MNALKSSLLILFFLVSACQTTPNSETELELLKATYSNMTGPAIFDHVGTPEGIPSLQKNEMPYPVVFAQFADAMASTEEWLTVSDNILNLKDQIVHTEPDLAFFYVEQLAAIHIVGKAVFDSMFVNNYAWSDRHMEVLSDQVEILIKNRNPQASLIVPALRQLQGYWPDARIKESALIAADAATDWVENDRSSELSEGMLLQNEAFLYRLHTDAAMDLRELAKEGS